MLKNIFIFEKYIKRNNQKSYKITIKYKKKFQPLRFFIFLLALIFIFYNNFFLSTFNINNNLSIDLEYIIL